MFSFLVPFHCQVEIGSHLKHERRVYWKLSSGSASAVPRSFYQPRVLSGGIVLCISPGLPCSSGFSRPARVSRKWTRPEPGESRTGDAPNPFGADTEHQFRDVSISLAQRTSDRDLEDERARKISELWDDGSTRVLLGLVLCS